MNHHRSTHSPLRRLGVATVAGAVVCTGGLVALLGLGGHVSALDAVPVKFEPVPPGGLDGLTQPTLPEVPTLDVPIVTIPEGPDGPIYDGPIITIPEGPDGPIFDGPIVTIPITPDDTAPPQDTTPPLDTTPPQDTTPQADPPAEDAPPADLALLLPYLEITTAAVDCQGMLHVSYETGANPQPAAENEHVVMFSPASNPAAVTSQRLLGRAVNGTFTVDVQAPAVEAYRVFVVADFEPANLDGIALVDEVDVPAPTDCPTTAG